jgi:thioredoxin 1
MATVELTKDNFEEVVTGNDIVVVDFWAPWCGPCKGFAPVFEAASEKHPDVVFAKVNTDEQQELAGHFAIRSIPTIAVFRETVILFSQAGSLPASGLENVVEQAKALDMKKVHEEIAAHQQEQQQGDQQTQQQGNQQKQQQTGG